MASYLFISLVLVSVFLVLYYKKYSVVGLLIITSPINRFYLNFGFALKPFLIVSIVAIFFEVANAAVLKKKISFNVLRIVRTNITFYLMFLFLVMFFLSDVVNTPSIDSTRIIILYILIFAGSLFFYDRIRKRADLEKAINAIFWTGFILGVSGLFFYAIYLYFPALMGTGNFFFVHHGGSLFGGVDTNEESSWVGTINLIAMDISGASYGNSLIPFIMVSIAVAWKSSGKIKKLLAFIVFIFLLINLYLTFSRVVLIATFFAFLSIGYFINQKSARKKYCYALFVVLLLLVLYPILLNYFYVYSEMKGFTDIRSRSLDVQTANRSSFTFAALNTFLENPLFGIGHNNFFADVSVREFGDTRQAHNTYVDLLAEHGLFVTGLYFAVFYSVIRKGMITLKNLNRNDPLYISLVFLLSGFIGMVIANAGNTIYTSFVIYLLMALILSFNKVLIYRHSNISDNCIPHFYQTKNF